MTLQEWCDHNGWTLTDIQHASRVAWTTVMRAKRGEILYRDVAQKISDATRGEVSVDELTRNSARGSRRRSEEAS